jgi:hypothetical protein
MSKAKALKIAWNIVKEGIKKAPGVARELLDDAGKVRFFGPNYAVSD